MAEPNRPEFSSGAGAGRAREKYRPPGTEPEGPRVYQPEAPVTERSPVDIVKDIVSNIQDIIRSEIRLAKAEMTQKVSDASRAGAMLAAGAVLALYAFGFFLAIIYDALAIALPWWLSALIVSFGLFIIAGILLSVGRKRLKRINPTPERTVQSVKEDVQWVRNQTR